jgi:uncharacterized membrane protein
MERSETKKCQSHFDMEVLVGYILLVGVLLSVLFLMIGLIWHWISKGKLGLEYAIEGKNLFGFLLLLSRQIFSGTFHPRFLVSLGIAVLLLTPLVRVIASVFYFAIIEHNWKYTIFTGFVTVILVYSLFLR